MTGTVDERLAAAWLDAMSPEHNRGCLDQGEMDCPVAAEVREFVPKVAASLADSGVALVERSDSLDGAWEEAEAALPAKEYSLSLVRATGPEQDLLYYAAHATCLTDEAGYPVGPFDSRAGVQSFGTPPHDTPAAALRSLAAALREFR